jgi:hypothetical protein
VTSLLLYGFIALIAVGVLFGLAVVLLPPGVQIAPPAPDAKPWLLSSDPLEANDVIEVKLPVALRGYRFAETDALLDRLTDEIRRRDEEIARLRGGNSYLAPAPVAPPAVAYEPEYDPTALRD